MAPLRHRSRRRTAVFSGVGLVTALLVFAGVDQLRAERLPVPDVVGLDVVSASNRLDDEGMEVRRKIVDHPGSPAGLVVRQSPAAGTDLPESGRVAVVVASGKVAVGARGVVGAEFEAAAARLTKLGLVVSRVDVPRATGVGKVVSLDKTGRVPDGATITLEVAVAMAQPTVVSTTGSSRATAQGEASSSKKAKQGSSKGKAKGKGKGRKK
ncbi:MAG: PASTA domain-containing protein [Actinomycetales bacterium]|nr:MAG: PASTA domain-containing protein [Actinomycetales bacterium]